MLLDFVASVDWRPYEEARPEVQEALGALQSWSTDVSEGVMPESIYLVHLRTMLSTRLRASG